MPLRSGGQQHTLAHNNNIYLKINTYSYNAYRISFQKIIASTKIVLLRYSHTATTIVIITFQNFFLVFSLISQVLEVPITANVYDYCQRKSSEQGSASMNSTASTSSRHATRVSTRKSRLKSHDVAVSSSDVVAWFKLKICQVVVGADPILQVLSRLLEFVC